MSSRGAPACADRPRQTTSEVPKLQLLHQKVPTGEAPNESNPAKDYNRLRVQNHSLALSHRDEVISRQAAKIVQQKSTIADHDVQIADLRAQEELLQKRIAELREELKKRRVQLFQDRVAELWRELRNEAVISEWEGVLRAERSGCDCGLTREHADSDIQSHTPGSSSDGYMEDWGYPYDCLYDYGSGPEEVARAWEDRCHFEMSYNICDSYNYG